MEVILNKQQLLQEAIKVSLSDEVTDSKRKLAQFMIALEQMRTNTAIPIDEIDVSGDWLENW